MSRTTKSRKGFTLVELAVVIVIIGVLAAFGVPQFLKSVERSKAAESFNYLSAVRAAQERYLAQNGSYATVLSTLDIKQTAPKYFGGAASGGDLTISAEQVATGIPTWSCSLARLTATSSYNYNVVFDQDGFIPTTVTSGRSGDASTIPDDVNPMGN
jgi:prepilin-type N-terminal cleavage/methylation domain-containing protein